MWKDPAKAAGPLKASALLPPHHDPPAFGSCRWSVIFLVLQHLSQTVPPPGQLHISIPRLENSPLRSHGALSDIYTVSQFSTL